MPYLILAIGSAFGIFGLYRFFLKASPKQVKALILSIAAIAIGLASLFLAVTGKLPAAIGILVALWPLGRAWLQTRKSAPSAKEPDLSEKEAYEILGLPETASTDDIKDAYIRLMKKTHPDQAGSDWIAKKINAAKELLLKSRV